MNRSLPIANALGCAVLVALILIQWIREQSLQQNLHHAQSQAILENKARLTTEQANRQLQSDIEGLKESLSSIRQAADLAEQEVGSLRLKVSEATRKQQQTEAAIATWQQAVTERDTAIAARDTALAARDSKLKDLHSQLVATRKRLDETIAQWKRGNRE